MSPPATPAGPRLRPPFLDECESNELYRALQPSRGWRRAGPPSGRAKWDPLGLLPQCSALWEGLSG